jgi:hypothetical protein
MSGALAFKQLLFVDLLEAPEGVHGDGYLKRTPKRSLTDCDIFVVEVGLQTEQTNGYLAKLRGAVFLLTMRAQPFLVIAP